MMLERHQNVVGTESRILAENRVKMAVFERWGYRWGYKVGLHFEKSGVTHSGFLGTMSLGGKLPIFDIVPKRHTLRIY